MNSARKIAIAGWGLGVLLTTSLVDIRSAYAFDGAGFELMVTGSPYSPIPEPFNATYANIGQALADGGQPSFASMGGLTADGNSIVITPQCQNASDPDHNTARTLTQVTLLGNLGYQYQVLGAAARLCSTVTPNEVSSFTLTINTNAASCLISGRTGQLEAGTYPVTAVQVNNDDFGGYDFSIDPVTSSYPAYIATKDGTGGTFTSADVNGGDTDNWGMSAYLPASRPCAPPNGPSFRALVGDTPFKTNTGRLGYGTVGSDKSFITQIQAQAFTATLPIASGGAGRYQLQQKMDPSDPSSGITGAKRIQALPLNAGTGASPYGGYRTDGLFVQCGASTSATTVNAQVRCRLGGTTSPASTLGGSSTASTFGVQVNVGGGKASDNKIHWTATGATSEAGQTVKFRSREVSWVGYGLHSPETTGTMTDGN